MNFFFRTFGGYKILKAGEVIDELFCKSQKANELFAFLLTNHRRKVPNEELYELFWPGMNYAKARQNLNTTMYLLRKSLGSYFAGEYSKSVHNARSMSWLELPPEFSVDFIEFEDLLSAATASIETEEKIEKLEEAVRLYKGDFMSDFQSSRWVKPFQKYYLTLAINALLELARLMFLKEKYDESMKHTVFALSLNPLNQTARSWKAKLLKHQRFDGGTELSSLEHPELSSITDYQQEATTSISPGFGGASIVDPTGFLSRVEKLTGEEAKDNYMISLKVDRSPNTTQKDLMELYIMLANFLRSCDFMALKNEEAFIVLLNVPENSIQNAANRILKNKVISNFLRLHPMKISYSIKPIDTNFDPTVLKAILL